ncbi:hypothetical protein ACHFJ0_05080 [Paracoccus sp. NGMCC 1.201697]|uniref:Uncharacterized protein n=1 Tax=Paracoccus broussonetiae subsp. drimophilus TaxID=3373869 RepID=A0ABW7LGY8_9RHOB
MLKPILLPFYEMIEDARQRLGDSAPKIADEVIERAFPGTMMNAEMEGCDRMLRVGIIEAIKDYLRKPPACERQRHFAEISEDFGRIAEKLKSDSYFVPGLNGEGEYVLIKDLVAKPILLDAARKFMRQKGLECISEAQILDELYEAVRASE